MKKINLFILSFLLMSGCASFDKEEVTTSSSSEEIKEEAIQTTNYMKQIDSIQYEIDEYNLNEILPEVNEQERFHTPGVFRNQMLLHKYKDIKNAKTGLFDMYTTGLYLLDLDTMLLNEIHDISFNEQNENIVEFYQLHNGLYLYLVWNIDLNGTNDEYQIYLDTGNHSNMIAHYPNVALNGFLNFVTFKDKIYVPSGILEYDEENNTTTMSDLIIYEVSFDGNYQIIYQAPEEDKVTGFFMNEENELIFCIKKDNIWYLNQYEDGKFIEMQLSNSFTNVHYIGNKAYYLQDNGGDNTYGKLYWQLCDSNLKWVPPHRAGKHIVMGEYALISYNDKVSLIKLQDDKFVYQPIENIRYNTNLKVDETTSILINPLDDKMKLYIFKILNSNQPIDYIKY